MPFTDDERNALPGVFSAPRFQTYLQAKAHDVDGALELYEWNLKVSSTLIIPLQVLEVSIRNGVADAIETVHGSNWGFSRGFLLSLPDPRRSYSPRKELDQLRQRLPTTGKIIADMKLMFWQKMFTAGHDNAIWNSHFRTSFPGTDPHKTIQQLRVEAYAELDAIRKLRNRIAHHEPIFARNIADEYARILKVIAWRSQVAADWVDKTQTVTQLLPQKP